MGQGMLSAVGGVGEIPGMPGTNPRGARREPRGENTHRLRLRDACATGRGRTIQHHNLYKEFLFTHFFSVMRNIGRDLGIGPGKKVVRETSQLFRCRFFCRNLFE